MEISAGPLVKLLGKLPGALQKWYWTSERLEDAVDIEVRSRGDSVSFDLGQPQEVSVWLRVTNLAPFPVTLDRARLELWSNGRVGELWCLERQFLVASKPTEVLVRGLYGVDVANRLRVRDRLVECTLQIDSYLNCKVREFVKRQRGLEGVRGVRVNVPAKSP